MSFEAARVASLQGVCCASVSPCCQSVGPLSLSMSFDVARAARLQGF